MAIVNVIFQFPRKVSLELLMTPLANLHPIFASYTVFSISSYTTLHCIGFYRCGLHYIHLIFITNVGDSEGIVIIPFFMGRN